MSLSTNTTYRIYVEKIGGQNPTTFVGDAGEVFYDPSSPTLKLSDGSTVGGLTIGSTSGGGSGQSYWVSTATGIHTLSNVGIGTTNPQTKLEINGVLGFSDTNVKFGDNTVGANLTSGTNNIFMGVGAGSSSTTGNYNNFFGKNAGYYNIDGSNNNFIGQGAGKYTTTGSYNSFFGNYSGQDNITGSYNLFFGAYTGLSTSSSWKVIIGSSNSGLFDSPDTTKDIQFAVGVKTDADPSKYWIVGNENFDVGIGTTNPTSKLTVQSGDVKIGVNTSQGVILTDANGVAWRLFVNTDGTVGTSSAI